MSSSHTNIKKQLQDDDDDDDLDELDDVLDQFNPSSSSRPDSSSQPAPVPSQSSIPSPPSSSSQQRTEPTGADSSRLEEDGLPSDFDDLLSQQFAKELAKGMEDMFGPAAAGAATAGTGSAPGGEGEASEEEMMKQFEKIMQEMGLGDEGLASLGAAASASNSNNATSHPSSSKSGGGDPANFQDAIKSTMSRLRQSQGGGSSSKTPGGGADPFADFSDEDMAKLLQGLGGEGGLPEGEEGMAGMLEKMMGELMSKEVLYEPLKELRDKYPPYFASPPTSPAPSAEDMKRFHAQYDCVAQVVKVFEEPDYDNGTESRKKQLRDRVADLMNQMQESGAPPDEVVGDMPAELGNLPGFGGGGNGQPGDEECIIM